MRRFCQQAAPLRATHNTSSDRPTCETEASILASVLLSAMNETVWESSIFLQQMKRCVTS